MLNDYYSLFHMKQQLQEQQEEEIIELQQQPIQKPIQDRLRQASHIEIESAVRNKVNLSISWYDIHGEQQSQKYVIPAGSIIEF